MWLASFSALGTQQTGLGRQDRSTLRSSHSCRRNPPTNKEHKWDNFSNNKSYEDNKTDVTVSDTARDLNGVKRALPISQTPPAGAQSPLPSSPA